MKAILVGLGTAGFHWYKRLRDQGLVAAVVETNEEMKNKLGTDAVPFYTSLQEAFERTEADFLVNVTTPSAHTDVNMAAFDRRLPVLCEKPISFDFAESETVVRRAAAERIPFMIAENYRRAPNIRKLKQLIEQGAIGALSSMDILFARYHQVERRYTVQLLEDVGVHHMDMIRYLSGVEGRRIQASMFNPVGGWKEEGAVLSTQLFIELERDIRITYSGTLAARGTPTPWPGNWRIEGTEGAIELSDQKILLIRGGASERIEDFSDVDASDTLAEFLKALAEKQEAETSGRDYLKTEALVHCAKLSSRQQRTVDVIVPEIG